ncbi:Mitoguardin 2 [Schistosoma japonicum]|uniref:Mitoguardin 2 n=1 Tax=Schistosoma japonicum TaxID=6182 RepID=A0A4Z2DAZ0_SCHJA|nr:Mitoguardin 2 [Schistosoma japonicum]
MTKEGVLSYIFHIDQLPSPKYFVSRKGLKSLLLSAAVGGAVISVVYYWLRSKRLKRPTSQSEDVDDVDAATTLSMHTIDYYSQTKLSSNRSAGSVLSRTSNMSDKRLLSSARRSPPLITNDFDDCSCSGLDYKKLGLHALAGVVEHLESLMSKVKILEEKGLSPSSSDSDNLINDLRILLEHAYRLREQYKQQLVIHDSTYRQGSLESLTTQEDTSSFFSASEQIDLTELELLMQFNVRRPLYYNALKLLNEGEVPYRALRTQFVGCELDIEYLGKVHCIRQGFDYIFNCPKPASWVIEVGKLNVCRLLHCLKYPLIDFEENYDRLMEFIISQQNKPNNMMSEELFSKGVKVINFYDVVIDLMLLDAFELLANPPSSVLSVTRHKWLSDNFKRCALDSTVWTILLAKRKLLKYPDGFYAHYYSMVGTVLPALAWGFLGPNENYFRICDRFREIIISFIRELFICYDTSTLITTTSSCSNGLPLFFNEHSIQQQQYEFDKSTSTKYSSKKDFVNSTIDSNDSLISNNNNNDDEGSSCTMSESGPTVICQSDQFPQSVVSSKTTYRQIGLRYTTVEELASDLYHLTDVYYQDLLHMFVEESKSLENMLPTELQSNPLQPMLCP